MRKQTVILTGWLSLPFICLTILMVWIFTSLDKDRLMDEPPVGAGAGDTGNANAIGEWLAGYDPDEISKANQARREHTGIEPFNWPGGTLITFQFTPHTQPDQSLLEARITIESQDKVTVFVRHPQLIDGTKWGVQLDQFGPSVDEAHIAVGYRTEDAQPAEWAQTPIPLTLIIAGEVLSSDPIEIPMRITIVTP